MTTTIDKQIITALERNKKALDCASNIADWLWRVQFPDDQEDARAGSYSYLVGTTGYETMANNWNLAFAIMGLLAAYKSFGQQRYETAALSMGRYLKTLQILSTFKPEHYGAIREISPQTPWCYTRDALSAAWGFLELYRHTDDQEYLERALLWAEWFMKYGMDDAGWPLWGHQFEPYMNHTPQMCNDIQGCFQGGSLNFFYHLAKITGDKKWVGDFFIKMADFFIDHIQQPSGLFSSIDKNKKCPPDNDPQNGLHRANDDLGTLGLLCAYRITGNQRYLKSIKKFITTVFTRQADDGSFDNNTASIPVVLNILYETADLVTIPIATPEKQQQALDFLFNRQELTADKERRNGGIIENSEQHVCARSGCYALIYLLKSNNGCSEYLTANISSSQPELKYI